LVEKDIGFMEMFCFMQKKDSATNKGPNNKCQDTFASPNAQTIASACKRAKFKPMRSIKRN